MRQQRDHNKTGKEKYIKIRMICCFSQLIDHILTKSGKNHEKVHITYTCALANSFCWATRVLNNYCTSNPVDLASLLLSHAKSLAFVLLQTSKVNGRVFVPQKTFTTSASKPAATHGPSKESSGRRHLQRPGHRQAMAFILVEAQTGWWLKCLAAILGPGNFKFLKNLEISRLYWSSTTLSVPTSRRSQIARKALA